MPPRSKHHPVHYGLRDASKGPERPTERGNSMTDPRNVAHDKKVQQEKKHQGEDIAAEAEHAPQPGKKPALKDHDEQADDRA
ncbi:hypothetical protein thsps117_12900 [Pseudomonas sp. No.117]